MTDFIVSGTTITGLTETGKLKSNLIIPSDITILGNGNNILNGSTQSSVSITFDSPSSVTTINNFAFLNSNLTSITLPNSLTTINNFAFFNCTGLKNINIPSTVTTFGINPFVGCPLTSITTNNNNNNNSNFYIDNNNGNILYTSTRLIKSTINISGSYQILSGIQGGININITSIDDNAFQNCTSLTNITLPNTLTTINNNAFFNCTSLTSITLQNGLQTIGIGAFENCTKLTSINIPSTVTTINNFAFFDCTSLTSINIPSTVTTINNNTFENCTSLTNITLPNGLQTIGQSAFFNCTSLTSITLPNGLQTIGQSAFFNCTNLTSITLKNGLQTIGQSAFYNCTKLTSINIPSTVTIINDNTFFNCTNLTSITLKNGLQTIGISAFFNCTSLTSITLPNGLQTIGQSAFSACVNLISINIPSSVTTFGRNSFAGCPLTEITTDDNNNNINFYIDNKNNGNILYTSTRLIKSTINISGPYQILSGNQGGININLQTIDSVAFQNCTNLTSITLPDGLQTIDSGAFQNCIKLTSITLPDGLQTISGYAFENCTLKNINIPSSVTTINGNPFINCPLNNITSNNLDNINFKIVSTNFGYILYKKNTGTLNLNLICGTINLEGHLIIDQNTRNINDFALLNSKITEITLPNQLIFSNPGIGALGLCPIEKINITNFDVNNSNFYIDTTSGGQVLYYTENAYNQTYLVFATTNIGQSYEIRKIINNKTIDKLILNPYAFSSCVNLRKIIINENLLFTFVGAPSFIAKCNLTEIINYNPKFKLDKSNDATILYFNNEYVFYSTQNIKNKYTILRNSKNISPYAFYNCEKLNNLIVPNTVINNNAFENCTNLNSITFQGVAPGGDIDIFKNCPNLKTIYYYSKYASTWKNRPWYIPANIDLVMLYNNKTIMTRNNNELTFTVITDEKIYKLSKKYPENSNNKNFSIVINDANMEYIKKMLQS